MPIINAPSPGATIDVDEVHNDTALAYIQVLGGLWIRRPETAAAMGQSQLASWPRGTLDADNFQAPGPKFRNSQKLEPRSRFCLSISRRASQEQSLMVAPLGFPWRIDAIVFAPWPTEPAPPDSADVRLVMDGMPVWRGTHHPKIFGGQRFKVAIPVPPGKALRLGPDEIFTSYFTTVHLLGSAEHEA